MCVASVSPQESVQGPWLSMVDINELDEEVQWMIGIFADPT